MVEMEFVREFALSLAGTEEYNHFDRRAFRINKRTFATLWVPEHRAMIKLSLVDQSVFSSFAPTAIFPVPNKWGLQGCTFFDLNAVTQSMIEDALTTAWQTATEKRIVQKK